MPAAGLNTKSRGALYLTRGGLATLRRSPAASAHSFSMRAAASARGGVQQGPRARASPAGVRSRTSTDGSASLRAEPQFEGVQRAQIKTSVGLREAYCSRTRGERADERT